MKFIFQVYSILFSKLTIKPEKREKYGKFDQKKERRNEKIGVVNLFIYKLVDKSIERTFTCIKVNLNIVTP